MSIWIVHGIYYEEDHYKCNSIESVHKSLVGACEKLLLLCKNRPYEEYEIKRYYVKD